MEWSGAKKTSFELVSRSLPFSQNFENPLISKTGRKNCEFRIILLEIRHFRKFCPPGLIDLRTF